MRSRRFRVGPIDGSPGATVTITNAAGVLLFNVRPLRRRRSYELTLHQVARGVVFDVVKAELREKRKQSKRQ